MLSLPFEAIIFDHDGTLVDTETPDFRAWTMLYEEFGASLNLEHWAGLIVGRLNHYDQIYQELIQLHGNGLTQTRLEQRLQELWAITLEQVELMPGVSQLLPALAAAGYRLGVATAADRAWAMRWLGHFQLLPFFGVVVTADDVIHNKPAPDVYLRAAAQLEVEPARCLVFEDSAIGVQAARAAGMTVVAVPSAVTQSLDFSQADRIVAGLSEVSPAWVETFRPQGAKLR